MFIPDLYDLHDLQKIAVAPQGPWLVFPSRSKGRLTGGVCLCGMTRLFAHVVFAWWDLYDTALAPHFMTENTSAIFWICSRWIFLPRFRAELGIIPWSRDECEVPHPHKYEGRTSRSRAPEMCKSRSHSDSSGGGHIPQK